ncbi:hypothetical protein [Lentilactobacillus otakiensis]
MNNEFIRVQTKTRDKPKLDVLELAAGFVIQILNLLALITGNLTE